MPRLNFKSDPSRATPPLQDSGRATPPPVIGIQSARPIVCCQSSETVEVSPVSGDDDTEMFRCDGGNPQIVRAETAMLFPQLVITKNSTLVERQNAEEAKELNGLLQGGIGRDQLVISASTPNFDVPAGQHFLDGNDGHRQFVRGNVADALKDVGYTVQEQAQRVRVGNPETHGSLTGTSRLRRFSSTFCWN